MHFDGEFFRSFMACLMAYVFSDYSGTVKCKKIPLFYYLERDVPPLLVYQLIRNCGNQLFTCMPEERTKLVKRFWSELKEKGIFDLY